jgi:hypothetical protein
MVFLIIRRRKELQLKADHSSRIPDPPATWEKS